MTKPATLTAAVREYVQEHPGATSTEIKDAIAAGEARLRNTISALLTADIRHDVMRVEIEPSPRGGRPVRRHWLIDNGPLTGRRRGRVWSTPETTWPSTQEDDEDDVVPRRPTWPPTDVHHHEPELRRPAPPDLGPAELADPARMLGATIRHVTIDGGHPALQITIPIRNYIDLLRRYR